MARAPGRQEAAANACGELSVPGTIRFEEFRQERDQVEGHIEYWIRFTGVVRGTINSIGRLPLTGKSGILGAAGGTAWFRRRLDDRHRSPYGSCVKTHPRRER